MERCGEVGKRFKAALVFGLGDELDVDRNFHKSWYKAKSANTYFETHIPRCENLKSFSALQDFFFPEGRCRSCFIGSPCIKETIQRVKGRWLEGFLPLAPKHRIQCGRSNGWIGTFLSKLAAGPSIEGLSNRLIFDWKLGNGHDGFEKMFSL